MLTYMDKSKLGSTGRYQVSDSVIHAQTFPYKGAWHHLYSHSSHPAIALK